MENELSNFILEIEEFKNSIQNELYNGIVEVGENMSNNARDFSAYDTGTLRSSWEIKKDSIVNEDGNKRIEVWSSPTVISSNPKHPNGDYYSIYQEEGWTDASGNFHEGRWMLESAKTIAQEELPRVLSSKIESLFD